eukprot:534590-Pleurochrysis_carterae.AAC.3
MSEQERTTGSERGESEHNREGEERGESSGSECVCVKEGPQREEGRSRKEKLESGRDADEDEYPLRRFRTLAMYRVSALCVFEWIDAGWKSSRAPTTPWHLH